MLFAEAPVNSLALVPLIFLLTAGFILGDLIGLVPFFLARWKNRRGMASLALLSCGVAGAVFLPLAVPVAIGFGAAALAMGRYDPTREYGPQGAAAQRHRVEDAVRNATLPVGLSSARFLKP